MKTHRVELQNGTLITIQGGDAQHVANFINNRLTHTHAVESAAECDEPAMEMPVLNFGKEQERVVAHEGDELPLVMPVLNFA